MWILDYWYFNKMLNLFYCLKMLILVYWYFKKMLKLFYFVRLELIELFTIIIILLNINVTFTYHLI